MTTAINAVPWRARILETIVFWRTAGAAVLPLLVPACTVIGGLA